LSIFFSISACLESDLDSNGESNIKSNYGNLPNYGKVKDFNIKNFDFSEVKNKIWLFNLFFTSCKGPCPITMSNLKKIHQKYPSLNLVSISVDPKRDTEEALKNYSDKLDLNTKNWFLLSTSKENRKNIIEDSFEIEDMKEAKSHSNRVFLIDENRNVRGAYVGTLGIDIEKLEKDLDSLL